MGQLEFLTAAVTIKKIQTDPQPEKEKKKDNAEKQRTLRRAEKTRAQLGGDLLRPGCAMAHSLSGLC